MTDAVNDEKVDAAGRKVSGGGGGGETLGKSLEFRESRMAVCPRATGNYEGR